MNSRKLILVLALAGCLVASVALAAADPVSRWWIGAGGGRSTGGSLAIEGALGQPAAGPASGGSVVICSGFWCGGPKAVFTGMFLPLLSKKIDPYAPPCSVANNYCENNDGLASAYGPLGPGREYRAYPEDADDFYYIETKATGSLTVRVTGYVSDGQLIVYNANDPPFEVGSDFNPAGGDGIMVVGVASLPAGKYFIRIYTGSDFSGSSLYTLKVDY